MNKKKVVFITGTRAEFGKLNPLIELLSKNDRYEVHIFVTGMHLLSKYGSTVHEIFKSCPRNIYMYNNQAFSHKMDVVLSNTIFGFSDYVEQLAPDLIVVHGDRVEAMAGAIVGTFNNILVVHIEGGELSGTVDEIIRHSISKLAHIHFVANREAKNRLLQMGEKKENIHVIGSPDIEVMFSEDLPKYDEVKEDYMINFPNYSILMYHPVTTAVKQLAGNIKEVVDAVIESGLNYVVLYPNNDTGSDIILNEYKRLEGNPRFKIFPSLRFKSFLVLLKNSKFIIGNSSCGIREAPAYSIPTINIGTRQHNRFFYESIFNVVENQRIILETVEKIFTGKKKFKPSNFFGEKNSSKLFLDILEKEWFWQVSTQKQFVDVINNGNMVPDGDAVAEAGDQDKGLCKRGRGQD